MGDDERAIPRAAVDRELGKAEQALADARTALAAGISEATVVARLYYACFHAAQAALFAHGFDPRSHGQVQTWLGRELVRPGVVAREHGRFISDMETYRCRLECGSGSIERDAEELAERTATFVDPMGDAVDDATGTPPRSGVGSR